MAAAHLRAAPVHAHGHGGRVLAPLVAGRMPELLLLTIFPPTGIIRLCESLLSIDALRCKQDSGPSCARPFPTSIPGYARATVAEAAVGVAAAEVYAARSGSVVRAAGTVAAEARPAADCWLRTTS